MRFCAVLLVTSKSFFSDNLRGDDIIARIGGDEFGVLLSPSREGNELDSPQMEIIQGRMQSNFLDVAIVRDYNKKFGDNAPLGLHVGYSIWEPGMSAADIHAEAEPKPGRHAISN